MRKANNQLSFFPQTVWFSLLILLLCCLIAYWPLTFHIFSLKNDALNYFLPVRYQISEAISHGYWPFWSPYFNLGYPLHGDMQSGVWNPFVQIFSLFGPYTLKTLQCETLLYVYLSGIGMFFLILYFFNEWRISLLVAAAFMLCGFNTDSGQFLNWISSASFLPFVFLFYYRTIIELNRKAALCCGIFLFLFFTTAYPADFILTFYLLVFLLIWHLFQKKNRTTQLFWLQAKLHFIIFICFLLLSLPAIISYAQFLPLSERGSGATYEAVMSNPLNPLSLFSYLTPLPAWKLSLPSIYFTDPLERNSFFGFITFSLLLLSFFIKSGNSFIRFLKWGFVFSVLFSFGERGGLRIIAYYLLPLMNTFRHPANAKLFSIFFGSVLAAFALQQFLKDLVKKPVKKYVLYILAAGFIVLSFWAFSEHISFPSFSHINKTAEGFKIFLDNLSFSDLLLFSIVLQIPFLIVVYFFFIKKINLRWLLIASLINCTLFAALEQPLTVVKKDSVAAMQTILDAVQQTGYPIPGLNTSLAENSTAPDYFKEIGVSNLYNKKIGRVNYRITPSNLLTQLDFWESDKIRNTVFQYPVVYKADTAITIADSSKQVSTKKRIVFVADNQSANFINRQRNGNYNVTIKKFIPNLFEIEIQSEQPGYYCIFQNYYPRWQLFVDGKNQTIERCNISFMGFRLPAGKHFVSFQYKSSDLRIAYFISIVTLVISLAFIFLRRSGSSC